MSLHWRAQCNTKWQRGCRGFQYPVRIKPGPADSLWITLTTKPWICVSLQEKSIYHLKYFATCNIFFASRIVILRLLRLNIMARHEIPEFFNTNLWLIHVSAFNMSWSWNILTLHIFCSLLIEQLIDLKKVRSENLKFRTDLRDQVMDGHSVTKRWLFTKTNCSKNYD